jgi:N-acetylglutamate synthase-like GNAT family acetyltransferase
MPRRLLAIPLAPWEREGLKAALVKSGLEVEDIGNPAILFWRFETVEDIPVGFGGIELHGRDVLLRSVVTLPPLRKVGMGTAIVAALEVEARALKCEVAYVITACLRNFFARLGYVRCAADNVPQEIRASGEFARHGVKSTVLTKRLV